MKNITAQLLALALVTMCVIPTTALATGQRVILGHAQVKECWTPISGGDGAPFGEQCITRPVPSVVDVYTDDMEFVTQVSTDSDGYFEISNLKPGTYVFIVSAITPRAVAGTYFPVIQTVTLHKKQETPFDFFLRYRAD